MAPKTKKGDYYAANNVQINVCVRDVFVSLHFVQLSEQIFYANHH